MRQVWSGEPWAWLTKERGYIRESYDFEQGHWLNKGKSKDDFFGDISELSPYIYDGRQMNIISIGRGNNSYKNIDKLNPLSFDAKSMREASGYI